MSYARPGSLTRRPFERSMCSAARSAAAAAFSGEELHQRRGSGGSRRGTLGRPTDRPPAGLRRRPRRRRRRRRWPRRHTESFITRVTQQQIEKRQLHLRRAPHRHALVAPAHWWTYICGLPFANGVLLIRSQLLQPFVRPSVLAPVAGRLSIPFPIWPVTFS